MVIPISIYDIYITIIPGQMAIIYLHNSRYNIIAQIVIFAGIGAWLYLNRSDDPKYFYIL